MRPLARGAAVAVLATAVAACSTSPSGGRSAPQPLRSVAPGWVRVADGVGTAVLAPYRDDHVLAAGERDGSSVLLEVAGTRARRLDAPLPSRYDRGLGTLSSDGLRVAAAELPDPSERGPASLWVGEVDDGVVASYPAGGVQDEQGRSPGFLSPVADGEEALRAVGAVREGDGWRLRAWEATGEDVWTVLDTAGPRVLVQGTPGPDTVLAFATEVGVVAAGALGPGPGGPQVWEVGDAYAEDRRWRQAPLGTQPDRITDLAGWDLGAWVAGTRALRPVVLDLDEGDGAALPVPDTALDPARPVVLLARVPVVDSSMVLATQSAGGPVVWVERAGGSWAEVAAPAGRLDDAVCGGRDLYVVLDGDVWVRPGTCPTDPDGAAVGLPNAP